MPVAAVHAHVGYGMTVAVLLEEDQVPAPEVGPRRNLVPVLKLQDRRVGQPLEGPEDEPGEAGAILLYVRPAGGRRREAVGGAYVPSGAADQASPLDAAFERRAALGNVVGVKGDPGAYRATVGRGEVVGGGDTTPLTRATASATARPEPFPSEMRTE